MKTLVNKLFETRPPWIPDNYIEIDGIFYRPDTVKKVKGKWVRVDGEPLIKPKHFKDKSGMVVRTEMEI